MASASTEPGLRIYSADRAEPLARRLAGVLLDDPLDPMEPEWLAVPAEGMRRWLKLELARHLGARRTGGGDGIAANFTTAFPSTLRADLLDATARGAEPPDGRGGWADPWRIDRMVWSLLALFDRLSATGAMPEVTHLPAGASRFTRVRTIADLFDRYHLHRPEMIRSWATGADVDGTGGPISPYARWQPELWRRLGREIAAPSPPERMETLLSSIRDGSLDLDGVLPARLLLFGFTSLPGRDFLPLVDVVAAHRQVHLFLLEPHRMDLSVLLDAWPLPPDGRARLRADDSIGGAVSHPLLRSWGRLPRESALLLADGLTPGTDRPEWVPSADPPSTTLLGRLQSDIRRGAESAAAPAEPGDRSIRFHSCFGPARQVQVARDALLHLLNDPGSDLAEEDILVVCPSLERFAPLIEAGFQPSGRGSDPDDTTPVPGLRHRIADRSMRTTNAVLGATSALLDLVAGRFELVAVLDFLSLSPVRQRFGFDDDDLAVVAEWATGTKVRWGLDPGHRAGFGIPRDVVGNSWQAAVDRLLLGTAVADSEVALAIGGVAPYGVDSGDAEVLGSFAHVLTRLASLAGLASGPGLPMQEWAGVLRQACGDLFAPPDREDWQFASLDRRLHDLVEAAAASSGGAEVPLRLLDLRRILGDGLDQEPGRPDYFRGGVTVTSMASLRWVPFRVVCILGFDQEAMGAPAPDAADLIAAGPQVSDPDPRSEARQWLLEAVLAARDHLLVVRDGRDVRSNHAVPQVVPAAELFDAVVSLVPDGERPALRETLEVSHPRHSFDEACLVEGAITDGVVWSFSARDLAGARRRAARPLRPTPFLDGPLETDGDDVIDLADLHAFLGDPTGTFLRRTLDVRLPRPVDEVDDILPVELGGVDAFRMGQDLLDARRRGVDDDAWRTLERARGGLPPGSLGERLYGELSTEIDGIVGEAAVRGLQGAEPEPFPVVATTSGGTRLVGTVPVTSGGGRPGPGRIVFARPKAAHRLLAWLDLMALVATDPSTPWRSVVVTRGRSGSSGPTVVDLVPSAPPAERRASAEAALEVVVDLFRRGMAEPLPLFAEYSAAVRAGTGEDQAWRSFHGGGDGTRPAVRLVLGDIDHEEVADVASRDGDPGTGAGRVARLAEHLWGTVEATATAPS